MPDIPDIAAALSERYVIERQIGAGGMAVVYLAHDLKLDREVALKVLRPELGAVLGSERFLTEIKIAARLDHPHILTLIDSGTADGLVYYVLPYVRGESLRAKITRERQLGLDEALSITKQVASALDYAHRKGLVHRDIKPENILFQEGEAMLTDFGIALAVTEAGGSRLTETGLSLGTPQYMSPEQATGDRGIDGRSDVYSLASVLYEMLTGEPPVTGSSAQAMIAKLITERPTRVRVLRDTVPAGIDAAVAKALAKTPADRFPTAGDFVHALEAAPVIDVPDHARAAPSAPRVARPGLALMAVVALAAIVAVTMYAFKGRFAAPRATAATLGSRTQLTVSGAVLIPAISPDGKQLAYATRHCTGGACTFSIEAQDIGGTAARTILEGATAAYNLEWSPDRRSLAFNGTIAARIGTYLLSTLGGAPRFLTPGYATFYAGGDSLLLGPAVRPDSVFWIRVAALDGVVHDSIRVAGPGQGLAAISAMPGANWIVTLVLQRPHGLWQVIDRSGKVADHVINACTCGGWATSDAVWLERLGNGTGESIVRVALDPTTGRLSSRQDTMVTALFSNFSVTADGAGMVMDAGTYDFTVWALDLADVMKGRFPNDRQIARASSPVSATVSPDGARLLVRRNVPTGGGHAELRFTLMAFAGGAETPLGVAGVPSRAFWADSVTVGVATPSPTGLHFAAVDVRTAAQRNAMDIPDSVVRSASALPDGWVWIPAAGDRIVVREGNHTREFRPPWYGRLVRVHTDPSGRRVFFVGGDKATGDSLGLGVLTLSDGTITQWTAMSVEDGDVTPLADGSALLEVNQTQESLTLFKLTGPDQVQRLGTIPRPLLSISASTDLKRATAVERDYRADAWLSKVVRQ
jgi:hypothetical protein